MSSLYFYIHIYYYFYYNYIPYTKVATNKFTKIFRRRFCSSLQHYWGGAGNGRTISRGVSLAAPPWK